MGVLAMAAYGDAVGAPYEFNEYMLKAHDPLQLHPYSDGAVGEWTDDTSMSLCVAIASLLKKPHSDEWLTAVGQLFFKWAKEHSNGIGMQTASILRQYPRRGSAKAFLELSEAYHLKNPKASAGNGGLMRVHPVALLPGRLETVLESARRVTALTHADPRCQDASVLWVAMLRRALQTRELSPRAGLAYVSDEAYWEHVITEALESSSHLFSSRGWWVVPSFQQALAAVHHNQHQLYTNPEAIFREIIEAPKSDSDTIACMAGALMGALGCSVAQLPEETARRVHGCWPKVMRLTTLQTLERRLLGG